MNFAQRQLKEIAGDPVLQGYGVALSLVNALTANYWLTEQPVMELLSPSVAPICWPMFSECAAFRILDASTIGAIVGSIFLLSLANAALFTKSRLVKPAYWLLLALTLLKIVIQFQDYRLILNQHYMANWAALVFLLFPDKRRAAQYLIALFYLWAGALKLNPDWVSGLALYGRRPLGMPSSLIPAACIYVIVLELIIVFGLFARRERLFRLTFAQLILFHISSFWVVGWFYPLLMFLLLSIFPLSRYGAKAAAADPPSPLCLWRLREQRSTYALIAIFCVLQLVPATFPGDASITGEGRMFALHMFDAPVECSAFVERAAGRSVAQSIPLHPPFLHARIVCDPLVYLYAARPYCKDPHDAADREITLVVDSRKQGQGPFRRLIYVPSFCSTNPTYSAWRHNWWIEGITADAVKSHARLQ